MVEEIAARGTAALTALFLGALGRAPYDFFTDRSGLSDGHSAMLVTGVERSVRRIRHIKNGAYVARSVLRAMALIVLATICFLACVFLVFVLVQWMRDTKRRAGTRPAADNKSGEPREKQPQTVDSRRIEEKCDRFKVGARRMPSITERSRIRESESNERERIIYERIARSFKSSKRT